MKHSGRIKVSTSGNRWRELKNEIHRSLSVFHGIRVVRSGTWEVENLDADLCNEILYRIRQLESLYRHDTVVREINISASPHVTVIIRRPVSKR
jgi:hypothetical protein